MLDTDLKRLLYHHGASLVGFADVEDCYTTPDFDGEQTSDSCAGTFDIPRYPRAVSILLRLSPQVVLDIADGPTNSYADAYFSLNAKLNELAVLCADFLTASGYRSFAQTTDAVKEYGVYRTILPHKTVATRAGLGFIGKCALLVTKEYGSAIRLTSVLTDAPLVCAGKAMPALCNDCTRCRDACPAGAISGKLWMPGMDRDTFFDCRKCREEARRRTLLATGRKITLCGKCFEVCPFTRSYLKRALSASDSDINRTITGEDGRE